MEVESDAICIKLTMTLNIGGLSIRSRLQIMIENLFGIKRMRFPSISVRVDWIGKEKVSDDLFLVIRSKPL